MFGTDRSQSSSEPSMQFCTPSHGITFSEKNEVEYSSGSLQLSFPFWMNGMFDEICLKRRLKSKLKGRLKNRLKSALVKLR